MKEVKEPLSVCAPLFTGQAHLVPEIEIEKSAIIYLTQGGIANKMAAWERIFQQKVNSPRKERSIGSSNRWNLWCTVGLFYQNPPQREGQLSAKEDAKKSAKLCLVPCSQSSLELSLCQ